MVRLDGLSKDLFSPDTLASVGTATEELVEFLGEEQGQVNRVDDLREASLDGVHLPPDTLHQTPRSHELK